MFEQMADQVVSKMREAIDRNTAPLSARMADLEVRLAAIAPGPRGEPGAKGEDGNLGKDGAPGADGRDGLDGKDGVNGNDGKDGSQGEQGASGNDGKDGADGLNGKDGLNGADGAEGSPGTSGRDGFNGTDGARGTDGRDGLPGVPGRDGMKGFDGANGRDGLDGFSLDDFDVELKEDGRTMVLRFVRGDLVREKTIRLATVLDAGVYSAERSYEKGDGVSYAGSFFIAQRNAPGKPEADLEGWRLAIKRGRDGKDASAQTVRAPQTVRLA